MAEARPEGEVVQGAEAHQEAVGEEEPLQKEAVAAEEEQTLVVGAEEEDLFLQEVAAVE